MVKQMKPLFPSDGGVSLELQYFLEREQHTFTVLCATLELVFKTQSFHF